MKMPRVTGTIGISLLFLDPKKKEGQMEMPLISFPLLISFHFILKKKSLKVSADSLDKTWMLVAYLMTSSKYFVATKTLTNCLQNLL